MPLAPRQWARSSGPWRGRALARVCALIRSNLHKPWSVADLATRLGVSQATLNRRLDMATGLSPHAWRNQRRVEQAQALLGDPLLTIPQIQRRCGFGSRRNFHRLLHQHCGMGPEAYRRQVLYGEAEDKG